MRAKTVTVAAALLAAGGLVPAGFAQDSPAEVCAVSIGRGATGPGGTTGTMTVRTGGRPCRIANFTVPEQRVATSRLELVRAPARGRVEIIQPNVVTYTPSAGYTGPDEFEYEGSGPGRGGRTLPFSVRIQVRVVSPATPLR